MNQTTMEYAHKITVAHVHLKSQLKFKIRQSIPQFSGCTNVFINKNKEKVKKNRSNIKLKRNVKFIFYGNLNNHEEM